MLALQSNGDTNRPTYCLSNRGFISERRFRRNAEVVKISYSTAITARDTNASTSRKNTTTSIAPKYGVFITLSNGVSAVSDANSKGSDDRLCCTVTTNSLYYFGVFTTDLSGKDNRHPVEIIGASGGIKTQGRNEA